MLRYPALGLQEAAIDAAIDAHDALVACLVAGPADEARLPRCADPDDQKFLRLAHASGARWLLSRDKAVLALARRAERAGLFRILPPSAWRPGD